MKIEDIKEKILKNKLKITPLVMAFTLVLGVLIPVVSVAAKEVPVYATILENNVEFYNEFEVGSGSITSMNYYYKVSGSTDPVYLLNIVDDCFEDGSICMSTWLISKGTYEGYYKIGSSYSPFKKNKYGAYLVCNMINTLSSSQEAVKGSENTSFLLTSSIKDKITLSGTNFVTRYTPLFDYLYSNNMQVGTETASGGLNSDLTNGSYDSSLGYLANLKLENYNLLEDKKYPVDTKYVVTWDYTRDDFDDTYKVAHYVKVHATFQLKKDLSYTSERIWVNDALYTDCKSSFVNSEALTSSSEYQSFIEEVEAVDKKTIGTYITEYEHNLIIYKETDSGIKYGFWNVLKLDKYGEGYVGSYLIPSYGIEDSEGNYVAMESGKPLGSFTYGQGGTFEEAENNSKVINSPIDGDGSDDLFATIEQYLNNGKSFIGNFPSLMGDIFENMPPHLVTMITIGLGLLLALRLFGR